MKSAKQYSTWFFILGMIYSFPIAFWIIKTPSLSNFFILNYSLERFLLMLGTGTFFILFLIGLILAQRQKTAKIYEKILPSRKLFFIASLFASILFLTLIGVLLNIHGLNTQLGDRLLPLLVLFFCLFLEIVVFQTLATHGKLPRSFLPKPDFQDPKYLLPNGRDLRLDLIRGLCIVTMVVDHVSENSPLYYLTSGNRFFTSSAEGFFLISGIVTGIVYSKVIARQGLIAALIKSLKRLLTIYLVTISLSFLILFVGSTLSLPIIPSNLSSQPLTLLANILSFKTQFNVADILVVYCLIFVLMPLDIILLSSNLSWVLLALSIGAYIFSIAFPLKMWQPVDTFVNIYGVQLFFSIGLVLGYQRLLEKIQHKINFRWLLVFGFSFFVMIFFWNMIRNPSFVPGLQISATFISRINLFFDRSSFEPGRILASLIVFGFFYIFATLYWNRSYKISGWILLPLGQNSLFAFTAHSALLMLFAIFVKFTGYNVGAYWLNGLIQLSAVMIIWSLLKFSAFIPNSKNRRAYYALAGIILAGVSIFEFIAKVH